MVGFAIRSSRMFPSAHSKRRRRRSSDQIGSLDQCYPLCSSLFNFSQTSKKAISQDLVISSYMTWNCEQSYTRPSVPYNGPPLFRKLDLFTVMLTTLSRNWLAKIRKVGDNHNDAGANDTADEPRKPFLREANPHETQWVQDQYRMSTGSKYRLYSVFTGSI